MNVIDIITQISRIKDLLHLSISEVKGIKNQDTIKELLNDGTFEIRFKVEEASYEVKYILTFSKGLVNIKPEIGGINVLANFVYNVETLYFDMDLSNNQYNMNTLYDKDKVLSDIFNPLSAISYDECLEVCKKQMKG